MVRCRQPAAYGEKMKLLLAFCLFVAPSLAHAGDVDPYRGLPYDEARGKILAEGWRPTPDAECYDPAGWRCEAYPEAVSCSGTGLGPCKMIWRHEDGRVMIIIAEQEPMIVAGEGRR